VASEGQNLDLAKKFEENLKRKNVTTVMLDLVKMNLPLYSSLAEKTITPSELMSPYLGEFSSDAFIFVAPEYNGSTPPTLSNFLAWVSRSSKSWREHFNNRIAAIASFNGGGTNIFTVMRIQLAHIGMNVLGRHVHAHFSKPVDEATIDSVCDQLIALAQKK
jgi:chromate reductase